MFVFLSSINSSRKSLSFFSSFTLIELLVVVSIIGFLASVVLVSMKGMREKGQISSSLQFSQSIFHNLGAFAVGVWEFDEGQGNQAKDASGYNNHCSFNGGVSFTNSTPFQVVGGGKGKYALNFNGSDGYLDCGNKMSSFITSTYTIESWIYPLSLPPSGEGLACENTLKYGITYYVDGRVYSYIQGGGHHISCEVPLKKWTHIAATFDGSYLRLYKNGKECASREFSGLSPSGGSSFWIGKWSGYFSGIIDNVRVYSKALELGEIREHFAKEKERYFNF